MSLDSTTRLPVSVTAAVFLFRPHSNRDTKRHLESNVWMCNKNNMHVALTKKIVRAENGDETNVHVPLLKPCLNLLFNFTIPNLFCTLQGNGEWVYMQTPISHLAASVNNSTSDNEHCSSPTTSYTWRGHMMLHQCLVYIRHSTHTASHPSTLCISAQWGVQIMDSLEFRLGTSNQIAEHGHRTV